MHPLFFKILRIELENSNFQTSVAAVFETNAATLKESNGKHETSVKSCEPRICIKLKVTMNNPLGLCLLLQCLPRFLNSSGSELLLLAIVTRCNG